MASSKQKRRAKPKGARGSKLLRVIEAEAAGVEKLPPQLTRKPCPGLWKTPVIRWDGELMACCADVDGELSLGSLRDQSFDELWFGERMTELRLLHIEGRFELVPKCWHCGGINFYKMDDEEIRSYLEEVGRLDLWKVYGNRLKLKDS